MFERRSQTEPSRMGSYKSLVDRRQTNIKHVVNTEHLPPESDDIDRTEQDKEQGELDPRETNRHV